VPVRNRVFIITWRRRHRDSLAEVAGHAPTVPIARVRSRRDLAALVALQPST